MCAGIKNVLMVAALAVMLLAGPAGAASPPASSFDGTYTGDVPNGMNLGAKYNCVAVPHMRLTVADGVATTHWNGPLSGPVSPDGSLTISPPSGTVLKGKFTATGFSGSVVTRVCNYTLTLTKG